MKLLVAVVLSMPVVLMGCSSAPVKTTQRQYCYTSQEIRTKDNETVSSDTTVSCNDDPIKQTNMARAGMARNCGYYKQWERRNGKEIERQYISCQKPDGTWESFPAF